MTNKEIAQILYETALLYEMEGAQFKPRAYERAAEAVGALDEPVAELYKRDGRKGLDGIPAVGVGIASHIEALLKAGTFPEYKRLKKKFPVRVAELTAVEGVGPKMVKTLYEKLKIRDLVGLEKAARAGKIKKIPHFGEKTEENILRGIEFLKKGAGRFLLGAALPLAREFEERLRKIPGVGHVTTAGSLRRMQETIGDIDILVTAKDARRVMEFFASMPEVERVLESGPTKTAVRLRVGINADARVLPEESYGAALQYFTGSKDHNVEVRKIAIAKGLKLNEYGLWRGARLVAGRTEEEVYEALGLEWVPPELRTNSGEIEASAAGKLPKIISYGSLRGDLQVQTNWTDGSHSIEDMARAALAAGFEYMAVTDHTRSLAMTGGLDEKGLARQSKEIDKINQKFHVLSFPPEADPPWADRFQVLKGAEVNILKNGALDIADNALANLDMVGAAVHSNFNLTREEQTKRIIRAMENPHVDIIFHPTGRVIGKREPYDIDIDEIIKAAARTGTALEIDAYPDRLDLKDEHARKAVEAGVMLTVDTDSHAPQHFKFSELGVAVARRGWATAKQVLNTKSVDEVVKWFKMPKEKRKLVR